MRRAHKKVSPPAPRKKWTRRTAAVGVAEAVSVFKGRWKALILFHLFDGRTRRFSDLLRDIPEVTEKVLAQQLRQLEREGVVVRTVYPTVPPMVEYSLTDWGKALCPAFDALLTWLAARPRCDPVARSDARDYAPLDRLLAETVRRFDGVK